MNKQPAQWIDGFGRTIEYLRLSVTDRCDFRCVYCMPAKMKFLPKKEILELEELFTIAETFIAGGVKKIRLTGGEPLVRRNILWLMEKLGEKLGQGLNELTITTNASQLGKMAKDIYQTGVRRINISLDSLNPKKFSRITRGGDLTHVLSSIATAQECGFKIKINMVVMKNINDDEIDNIIAWCIQNQYDLTFIEVMPMALGEETDTPPIQNSQNRLNGDEENWAVRTEQFMPLSLVRGRVMKNWSLAPSQHKTGGPATYYATPEGIHIGFITPMTNHFCAQCNRVRLTTTGKLFLCLGKDDMVDLRHILRQHGKSALQESIHNAMMKKPLSHDFVINRHSGSVSQKRHMVETGG